MKKLYFLLALQCLLFYGFSQTPAPPPGCDNGVVIKGNKTDGLFKQLFLDNRNANAGDTSQPEIVAAAWTCDAQGSPTCDVRSLFKYDLRSIPTNKKIGSAKLYLYAKTTNINGQTGNPTFGSANTTLLQRVTKNWNLATTGWSNQPTITTSNQKVLAQSTSTAQNYVIDVTDFVQYWVNKPDSNYGVLIRLQNEVFYNSMIFHSGSGPDSLRPRLEICYDTVVTPPPPPPPPPTTPPAGCDNGVVIKGNKTDGLFKQLFIDHRYPTSGDTSQPEIAAAAWTCNSQGSPTCDIRSLFKYDLRSIPTNKKIGSAKLYLYAKTNNINGQTGNPTYGAANTALLQRITQDWDLGTTGWSNQPAVATVDQKILAQSTSTVQNYVIDVTDFVQHWINEPDSNYGVLIRLQNEVYYNSMIFHSGSGPDSLRPRLEICYDSVVTPPPPPPPPPTPPAGCDSGVVIKGNKTDGLFKQLFIDHRNGTSGDTTQPEIAAAAWTCNSQGSPTCNLRSLFKYDLRSIPTNKKIGSAKLYLYAKTNSVNGTTGSPTYGTANTALLQRITQSWNMIGTGWDNQPTVTTSSQKVLAQSTSPVQNYVIDITDFVQYWVNKPDSNYGVLIRLQNEMYYNSMIFHSGNGPESLRPRLEICFDSAATPPPPPPPPACNNSLVIKGDRVSGLFKQQFLDNRLATGGDTTQPEIAAAAWTCNSQGSPTCDVRSLFRYDVRTIPANAVITGAKLYLYAKADNINGTTGSPMYGTANTTLLQRVTQNWVLGATGWSNQPAITTSGQKVLPQSMGPVQNYVVDMKDFVQYWVNKPDSNYGVLIRLQNEVFYNSMIFHSGNGPDSLKPRLEICYTLTTPDSCKADFRDSTQSSNSLIRQFTGLPWNSNNKKVTQICWKFGDGKDTCINYNPGNLYNSYQVTHQYANAGTYNVCIKITYEGGCSKELCKSVTVIAPPTPPACNNTLVIKGNKTNGQFKQLWLDSNAPNHADNSQPEMGAAAWTCNAIGFPTCNMRSLFRFDVSNVPANAVITNAKLYLYAKTNNINGNPGNPTFGNANSAVLQRVTQNWNIIGTGWSNQPPTTANGQKVLPQSSGTAQNYVVDMTDLVQYWVNKPDSNYGALLRLQLEEYYNSLIFHSGSSADSVQPRLEICYTAPVTGQDSCRANFNDSTSQNNPLDKRFIPVAWNSANKKPVQICWNFGDGTDTCYLYTPASNIYQVNHLYRESGNYTVCVTVKYEGGCVATKCRKVTVFGLPTPPPSSGCANTIVVKGERGGGKFSQAFISTNHPNSSDTTQPELGAAAWTCYALGSPTCDFRSLFRYDLSAIPTKAKITGAKLYLYAKTNNINGYAGQPTYGDNNTALLQQVVEPWSINNVAWANQPSATAQRQKVLPQSSQGAQSYVIDVSDFVQDWVKHPEQNYGMLLRLQTEAYYNSMVFHSGNAPDSLKPRLEICYDASEEPGVEIKVYPNPTTGPILAWVFTPEAENGDVKLYDPQGNLKQVIKNSIHFYPGVNVIPMQINRAALRSGPYFVKVRVGGTTKTFKIFIL